MRAGGETRWKDQSKTKINNYHETWMKNLLNIIPEKHLGKFINYLIFK